MPAGGGHRACSCHIIARERPAGQRSYRPEGPPAGRAAPMAVALPMIGTAVVLSWVYQAGICQPASWATVSILSRAGSPLVVLKTAASTAPPGRGRGPARRARRRGRRRTGRPAAARGYRLSRDRDVLAGGRGGGRRLPPGQFTFVAERLLPAER